MKSWVVSLLAMTLGVTSGLEHMTVEHEWRMLDFLFPNQSFRDNLTNSGAYVNGTGVAIDVDVSRIDRRIFITLPKIFVGAPPTLCTVSNQTQADGSPLLAPYPDWSWHRSGDCDGITSVFRVKIDECNRLWVIDSGHINYLANRTQLCPPQLLVFDLATNTLIKRHRFPSDTLVNNYLLLTVEVETSSDRCEDAHAYVADVTGFGVLVYNLLTDRSWRVSGNYFYPFPRNGRFLVAGVEFYVMGGVMGLAVSPRQQDGDRRLYFQSVASDSLSWVLTSVLRNESNFPNGSNLVPGQFHIYSGTRASQTLPIAMDSRGVLFFSYLSYNSINCWNSRRLYGRSTIAEVERDDTALQFVGGVKVMPSINGTTEEVWALSNRYQIVSRYNRSEINFRVLKGNIRELVRGSRCQ